MLCGLPTVQQAAIRDGFLFDPFPRSEWSGPARSRHRLASGWRCSRDSAGLLKDKGVTLDALVKATGWRPHTTRAALTGLGVYRSSGSSTRRRARTTGSRVDPRGFVAAFTSDKQLDRSGTSLRQFPPSRIVCLTEETVETLYLLDEQDLIVGVSGYAVRPPQVRREKPRVSAFTSADIPKVLALEPDLVLTFSDLQAPIAAELIRAGVAVHAFNQRDIAGILAMIRTVGALVGAVDKAEGLARRYESRLGDVAALVRGRPKPKVYFEERDDPLISSIGWVSELIEIAGGEDVFPELRKQKAAKDHIVSPHDVIAAAPDVFLAGKRVVPDKIRQRPGWDAIPAVRNDRIVEIKSPLILQPGPAGLTDGLDAILAALGRWK
jgi:iron complex transport system substrate-binding protein